MPVLSKNFIQNAIADSSIIFQRGNNIYQHGSYFLAKADLSEKTFIYEVDGSYGNYTIKIQLTENNVFSSCNCPYPGDGCKHVVAAMLNVRDILLKKDAEKNILPEPEEQDPYLTEAEIKEQALADRKKRALSENFTIIRGDMFKGDHLVINKNKKEYTVCLHDPEKGIGHCTCPDYLTNGLGTCKHIEFLSSFLKQQKDFKRKIKKELFPFTDIFWDSLSNGPGLFTERPELELSELHPVLKKFFNAKGLYISDDLGDIMDLLEQVRENKKVRVREALINRVDIYLEKQQLKRLAHENFKDNLPELSIKTELYPYQKDGVDFGLFKKSVLIGDEMGLGKTIQAISLGILKKEIFGFSKILIVTLASLKDQWKREIEKFSDEKAAIVAGSPVQRKETYFNDKSLFKITNYEAVLRDVLVLSRFKPDIIVLDEAQRIKNFSTKTANAVKRIPKKHAIVLTGTPLENKLEDVYSIVQFLDPYMLTPLWKFAADHFMLLKNKKGRIAGYRNLEMLQNKLKPIVIRRKKEDVLKDLPDEVVNNYYIDLSDEQYEIHGGYARLLLPLINKKFLTPMDLRKIQIFLLRMRMACDSTYLIDRETNISPKLKELEGIIDELVIENKRKMVIFSEWTTMTFLIAKHLSDAGIPFVELSGKVPVKKRQALIDEFTNNPDCSVFLSTDAGGTGLNLQAADCIVNFELPWNPAKMNQRIGRVSRIGQKSKCINVVNLIAKHSIEEKILTGIQLKTDLFKGVFDDGPDTVEFSREKRNEMLNRLREMMGEEKEPETAEPSFPDEIPEDTPHFLNPEVLNRDETTSDTIDVESGFTEKSSTEKPIDTSSVKSTDNISQKDDLPETEILKSKAASLEEDPGEEKDPGESSDNIFENQSPEKIENVLNSGMEFLGGLMEMALGQKIKKSEDQKKMIKIDKTTGEVTMKFKLPGF